MTEITKMTKRIVSTTTTAPPPPTHAVAGTLVNVMGWSTMEDAVLDESVEQVKTPNSKPQTPNPKPQTPKPKTQNPNQKKPKTPNPKPQTPNTHLT